MMELETVAEENDHDRAPSQRSISASPTLGPARLHRTPLTPTPMEHTSFLLTELHDSERDIATEDAKQSIELSTTREEIQEDTEMTAAMLEADDGFEEDFFTDVDVEGDWNSELEECSPHRDATVKTQYLELCHEMGVHPVSSFIRHIKQDRIALPHYGLGPGGVKPITIVLRNLSNNRIGSIGVTHIAKMLCRNIGLRHLNISGNQLEDGIIEELMTALERNQYLEGINLSKNKFGEKGGEIFGPAIGANESLQEIDLSWNHIRLKGGSAIAKGLRDNVRLKKCNLAHNGFGVEGGLAMAETLIQNSTLRELDLTGNRITDICITKIAKSLLVNESLQILRLGKNPISTTGAVSLVTAINSNDSSGLIFLELTVTCVRMIFSTQLGKKCVVINGGDKRRHDISVEYEFLRIIADIKHKREFKVIYGYILRSGNTDEDLGKKAIEMDSSNRYGGSLVILQENIVVKDQKLMEILTRYDTEGDYTLSPENIIAAVKELNLQVDTRKLMETLQAIANRGSGKIYFGDLTMEDQKSTKA